MIERYFDCNATSPLSPAARTAWQSAEERHWHNPSGLYHAAAAAKLKLEEARERLAALLDCDPAAIIFTSGATESNNAILSWVAHTFPQQSIAISAIEHPSVARPAAILCANRLRRIPCTADGRVNMEAAALMADKPALISMMAANNETGVLQPWQETAEKCRHSGILFHCDAAQWLGRLPLDGLAKCDFLTGSAHKFGGPKGVGFLKAPVDSVFRGQQGGPQESRRRAGTENLPGILAMVTALEERQERISEVSAAGRDEFECTLMQGVPEVQIVGAASPRLWNTSMVIMPQFANLKWITRLSDLGFAISTGAACSTGEGASVVLEAMGYSGDELRRVLRVSGGWWHRPEDWRALGHAFLRSADALNLGAANRPKIRL